MSSPSPSPEGWHPDPSDATRERYWSGAEWTGATRPIAQLGGGGSASGWHDRTSAIVLLAALGGAAVAMFTSVSLLGGMGQVEFGAVIACIAAIAAFAARTPMITRLACLGLALLAVVVAVSDYNELQDRRDQIQNIFNTP